MARFLLLLVLSCSFAACGGGGDRGRIVFRLSSERLPDLGRGSGHYEGFALVDGVPLSTGKFIVNALTMPPAVTSPDGQRVYGTTVAATFGPSATGLGEQFPFIEDATGFFVTVEAEGDRDRVPSGNVVCGGLIVGRGANLDSLGLLPLGGPGLGNFTGATGRAVLVAPTGSGANPESGVWFVEDATGALPSLTLPSAEGAWTYEGFVTVGGVRFSTGKFRDPQTFDFDAQTSPTRGPMGIGFLAPGQDFLTASLRGTSEILDLVEGGWRTEVTIEPRVDNAEAPFPLRLFEAAIPVLAVNMAGQGVAEITLDNLAASLPFLNVQLSPGLITCMGRAPGGLGPMGAGVYVLWVETPGVNPVLVAAFSVSDGPGTVTSPNGGVVFGGTANFAFDPANTGLGVAFPNLSTVARVFITQEAFGLTSTTPSEVVVLDGAAVANQATLRFLGAPSDLAAASGTVVCLSPTDDGVAPAPNDGRGIWFRFLGDDFPSLIIPELAPEWTFEAWVVHPPTARRYSTGKFRSAINPDFDAALWPGRGPSNLGFADPGQDFVTANAGTTVPALQDFRGATVMITLEPTPDTSADPTPFVLLQGVLPATVLVPGDLLMNQSALLPAGRVEF